MSVAALVASVHAAPDGALAEGVTGLRVEALTAVLENRDTDVRTRAARALARLGAVGEQALLKGLRSDVRRARVACAAALGMVSERSELDRLRGDAARAVINPAVLRGLEPLNPAVIPHLVAALNAATGAREREVVSEALVTYAAVGKAHEALYAESARGRGPLTRPAAYMCLARLGPTATSAPLMVAGLGDSNESVRSVATRVLAPKDWIWHRLGKHDDPGRGWKAFWIDKRFTQTRRDAVTALVAIAVDEGSWARARAVNALGGADWLPEGGLAAVRSAYQDCEAETRWRTGVALARLAERGLAPVSVLSELLLRYPATIWKAREGESVESRFKRFDLRIEASRVQQVAAETLWRLGPKARPAIPAMKEVLEKGGMGSTVIAGTLSRLGEASDELIVCLAHAYSDIEPWDTDPRVQERRRELGECLRATKGAYDVLVANGLGGRVFEVGYWWLEPEAAIRALEPFTERREATAKALRLLKPKARWLVRLRAIEVLHRLGLDTRGDRERLIALIEGTAPRYLRIEAVRLLRRMDPNTREPIDALVQIVATGSPHAEATHDAAGILSEIGNLPTDAKTRLLEKREFPTGLRPEIVLALGADQPFDDSAIAALRRMLKDPRMREWAARTLARVGPTDTDSVRALLRVAKVTKGRGRDEILKAIGANPAAAAVAVEILGKTAETGDLRFAVDGLSGVAPDSAAARALRRRCAASLPLNRELLWLIESGNVRDRALFRFLVPRMVAGVDPSPLDVWKSRPLYKDVTDTVLGMMESGADRAQLAAGLGCVVETTTSRAEALRALGALGTRAKRAASAVRGLVDDPELGRIACETLSKIE